MHNRNEHSLNLEKTKRLARQWIQEIKDSPGLIFLNGPMGAGKTQFLRYCLEALGVTEVASPTYAIHHEYKTSQHVINHFDLYRLEDEDDLESTGFWEIVNEGRALVFIEWSDRLDRSLFPKQVNQWQVLIQFSDVEDRRDIQIAKLN